MKLSDKQKNEIKIAIIRKLVMHRIWGAKHTSFEFVQKGLPKELRGYAKDVAEELIRGGFLLSHPTSYGIQISLNPDKAEEIKDIIITKSD